MKADELFTILYQELETYAPRSRFYSVREIMRRYSCNQRLVMKVIRKLEKAGAVECRPHVGIFCALKDTSFKWRLLLIVSDWPSPAIELWKNLLRQFAEKSGRWVLQIMTHTAERPMPVFSSGDFSAVCINRPPVLNREYVAWLQQFDIPTVLTGCRTGDLYINTVNGMDEFSGNLLAKYLYDRGHRSVLSFNSEPENSCVSLRKEGFSNMAELLGMQIIQLDCGTVVGEYSQQRGYEYLKQYIETHGKNFSAVFMTTSSMAVCVYKTLQEYGLRVPEDVSVVGCDRVEAEVVPPLTHIQYEEYPEEVVFRQLEKLFAGEIDNFHYEIRPVICEGLSTKNILPVI